MTRVKIPQDKLQKMAREHISYEIQMFVQSFAKLQRGNLDIYETNSTLETFLVHARCLLDFLYPQDARADDVIADDFFEDLSSLRKNLPKSLLISNYLKKRAGKEIAHLTYGRLEVAPIQKQWNFKEIHDKITDALATFFEFLPDEKRWWFSTIVTR